MFTCSRSSCDIPLLESQVNAHQDTLAKNCIHSVVFWHRLYNSKATLLSQAFAEGLKAPAPAHVGAVLTLAHFLDHMYHNRPAKRVEASPWYQAATAMVQDQLSALFAEAPKVAHGACCPAFPVFLIHCSFCVACLFTCSSCSCS